MEEILASIRRIISDDDTGNRGPPRPGTALTPATARADAKNSHDGGKLSGRTAIMVRGKSL